MKYFTLFISAFLCVSVAQESNFNWSGDGLFDENNTQVGGPSALEPVPGYTALTLFSDLNGLVTSNEIQLSDILSASFHPTTSSIDIASLTSGPPPLQGNYLTEAFFDDTTPTSTTPGVPGYVGQTAYLLVHQGNGSIQVGDFIGLSSSGTTILDRELLTPQEIDGGTIVTNIEVIPEPSTFLFLVLAFATLGIFGGRRYYKK